MTPRRPIPPNPPRWTPNPDPASIHVPGLDTSASVHEQIEQLEQLITIKLQVRGYVISRVIYAHSVRTSMKTSPKYTMFSPPGFYLQ